MDKEHDITLMVKKDFPKLVKDRTLFIPNKSDDKNILGTRSGGRPGGRKGEVWPLCPSCQNPIKFVMQVNGASLKHKSPFAFYAFYYCWGCASLEAQDSTFIDGLAENATGWLVLAYESLKEEEAVLLELPDKPVDLFSEYHYVAVAEKSLPDFVGLEAHHPQAWELIQALWNKDPKEYYEVFHQVNDSAAQFTKKITEDRAHLRNTGLAVGGYPYWCNGGDVTPICPDCQGLMELLLQTYDMEAEWGDVWTAYIFVCPTHKIRFGLRFQGT